MNISAEDYDSILKLNLSDVIEDMFMVLNNKEREVVVKRFSLDNKERRTLESIGRNFNVTRERVRQIEKIALNKLKRTVNSTKLKYIHDLAQAVLKENGGVMVEKDLVKKILAAIEKTIDIDAYIVKLSLTICPEISSLEKNNTYRLSWHLSDIPEETITEALNEANKTLKKNKKVMKFDELSKSVLLCKAAKNAGMDKKFVRSALTVDLRIKEVEEGYGLMTWRHINPKSIRDKALIILGRSGKPMHFVEIANEITGSKFDSKKVTVQAVHNELIRYENFILVGRGLYALKDWGFQSGTVTEIIESLLEKKSPMTKQEIIKGVLGQRQVKKGTISLNLQKNPQFVRVGRAVYELDKSKNK